MIPRTLTQNTDWKQELRQAVTRPEELLELLDLPKSRWLNAARQSAQLFPLKVPRGFIDRMQPGDIHDPLLRQVLPVADEMHEAKDYSADPVGDGPATAVPGLLHKYHRRALVITTGACAVHCRYCFRRHYPYSDSFAGNSQLDEIEQYLHSHAELNEVILSGGDPLMLDSLQLGRLLRRLASVPHIRWIRLHSRLPVVLPERIDQSLLTSLQIDKPVTLVIHSNHPQELDNSVAQALLQLHEHGLRLFNQSVLLRGINDDAPTLCDLSYRLFDLKVQPYYLHMLDQVLGAAHFAVAETRAIEIYRDIQTELAGFLLPRLVRETAGAPSKTLINI